MDEKQEELKENIKLLTKQLVPKRPVYRADYQMTLGSVIKALNKERTGVPVYAEFLGTSIGSPGLPHSYYGYPSDLAFAPNVIPITVAEFLKICQDSVDKSFIASDSSPGFYRDHTIKIGSPVWVSQIDSASMLAIVDVISENSSVILKTEKIEEKEE